MTKMASTAGAESIVGAGSTARKLLQTAAASEFRCPAVGTVVRLRLPHCGDHEWDGTIYEVSSKGQAVIRFAGSVYRKVDLQLGAFTVLQQHSLCPYEPQVDANLADGLKLLNETVHIWLHQESAVAAEAVVVAYRADLQQHVLYFEGHSRLVNLKQHRYTQKEPQAKASEAMASSTAFPPVSQQRKQTTDCGAAVNCTAGPASTAEAWGKASINSGVGPRQHNISCKVPEAVHDAPGTAGLEAARAHAADEVGGKADAAAVVSKVCVERLAPTAPAAGDATSDPAGRSRRTRQPSSRLILPGEQQTAAAHAHSTHAQSAVTVTRVTRSEWPTDNEVLQAVAAAQVPALPAGPGAVFLEDLGPDEPQEVCLASFLLGNPLSCHVGRTAAQAELCRQVVIDGELQWQQVSQPCHDCQEHHIPRTCQQEGCSLKLSVCNRCLLKRYTSQYSLQELLERCPCCRLACACSRCLRDADPDQLVPLLQSDPQEQIRQAQYVLRELLPYFKHLIQLQRSEVTAWGFSCFKELPAAPLAEAVRPLCDRCATQFVGVAAQCPQCTWDFCCQCVLELRQSAELAATAAGAGAGTTASAGLVTCCNPRCGRASAGATQQQQHQHALAAEDQQDSMLAVMQHRNGQQQQQGPPRVMHQQLPSRPDAPALQLQLVVPPDLLGLWDKLLQLVQSDSQHDMQLQDCPLLTPHDLQLLRCGCLSVPGTREPLSLQHLLSCAWWHSVPGDLSESWRRCAAVPTWDSSTKPQQRQHKRPASSSIPSGVASTQHAAAAAGTAGTAEAAASSSPSVAEISSSSSDNNNNNNDFARGWVFTPHASELCSPGPTGLLARLLFWARWRKGEPIIVRGVKGAIPWDPDTLERAMGFESDTADLEALDCQDFSDITMTRKAFFSGYLAGHLVAREHNGVSFKVPAMYKVKDWPPSADFRQQLCRHYADFLAAVPVRCYTDPRPSSCLLNLATALQPQDNPTDLGPKCYIAYGRVAESVGEGDSVTKCHIDMTDAVNLLLGTAPGGDSAAQQVAQQQQQQPRCGDQQVQLPEYGGAGAVWDIWSRASLPLLNDYLLSTKSSFTHMGMRVPDGGDPLAESHPVLSQAFMLSQRHREGYLAFVQQQQRQQRQRQPAWYHSQGLVAPQGAANDADASVQLWHVEQYAGEAVFIPGGCAHQVRNLKSCCKAALDFVSPESMGTALQLKALLRSADLFMPRSCDQGPEARHCQEKLQSQLILLRAVLRAADALHTLQQQ